MSAHGDETNIISETPDGTDVEWDPPMADDIIFGAGELQEESSRSQSSDDTDVEWDPPMDDDIVLGTFENMISWGDEMVMEDKLDRAVGLYESAQRTQQPHLPENDQLVHSKLSVIYLRQV